MTQPYQPMQAPQRLKFSPDEEMNALNSVTQMMTGTSQLQDHPGIVYSLAQAQARPQDAQMIDQFLQGLDAEKSVQIARASGQPIELPLFQRLRLDALNVPYNDVLYTSQSHTNQFDAQLGKSFGGDLIAKRNQDGTLATDPQGRPIVTSKGNRDAAENAKYAQAASDAGMVFQPKAEVKKQDAWSGGFLGDAIHVLKDDVLGFAFRNTLEPIGRDVLKPAINWTTKGLNSVLGAITLTGEQNAANAGVPSATNLIGAVLGGKVPRTATMGDLIQSQSQDMQAKGYSPDALGYLAYLSSGKAVADTSDIKAQIDQDHPNGLFGMNGDQLVGEAEKAAGNPKAYRTAVENDPANFTTDANGKPVPTEQGLQKLQMLASPEWNDLLKQVSHRVATPGDQILSGAGWDSGLGTVKAAGIDLAISFMVDPLLLGGKLANAVRLDQVGMNTLADANGAVKTYDAAADGARSGMFVNGTRRRVQNFLDMTHEMADAFTAGDTAKGAGLMDRINTQHQELAPLMQDVLGANQHIITPSGELITGEGPGIHTLKDFAGYVGSKAGLVRLMNGQAAVVDKLVPGAVSKFGYRYLRGLTAGWLTERSAARSLATRFQVEAAAESDPLGLGKRLLDDGIVARMQPQADDIVDAYNGATVADKPIYNAKTILGELMAASHEAHVSASELASYRSQLDDLNEELIQARNNVQSMDDLDRIGSLQDSIRQGNDLVRMLEADASAKASLAKSMSELDQEATAANAASEAQPTRLASQARAQAAPDAKFVITPKGVGEAAANLRRKGSPFSPEVHEAYGDLLGSRKFGWASPTAIAERSRLAAARFTNKLPRNYRFDVDDPQTALKIEQFGRTWLNRGDAALMRGSWTMADDGGRKAIMQGLVDSLAGAAGLTRTEAGQKLIQQLKTENELYSAKPGQEIVDDMGRSLAMHGGQVRQEWVLPGFTEWRKAAQRLGVWESTMGRAVDSQAANELMGAWKIGALMKPSTVSRNLLEAWLRSALEGNLGMVLKARAVATMRNKELWDRGYGVEDLDAYRNARSTVERIDKELKAQGLPQSKVTDLRAVRAGAAQTKADLENTTIVQHLLATEAGNTDLAKQIARGSYMSGQLLGRSGISERLANFAPLALMGRAYRDMTGVTADPELLDAFMTLSPSELATMVRGFGEQYLSDALGFRKVAKDATEAAKAGWGTASFKLAVKDAKARAAAGREASGTTKTWGRDDLEGAIGADRYADELARRVTDTPEVATAALNNIEGKGTLDAVVAAMDANAARGGKVALSGWGHYWWPQGGMDGERAAKVAQDAPEQVALGKREWAGRIVEDYRWLLTGQNGQYQQPIADFIRSGRAPSGEWIVKNIKGVNRPDSALVIHSQAVPNGGVEKLWDSLLDGTGGAYQWMVERPLHRIMSAPTMWANYAIQRKAFEPLIDNLVEQGLSRQAGEALAKEMSMKNALVKTEALIDDPGQLTQFDVVARNIFPFARATQAMIRRWGNGLWNNPLAARKMMLAYEGAQQSGFIYNNQYGEPVYVFPASGVMNMALRELAKVPGFQSLARFPVSASMTGGVLMSVPGADNPFRMSAGPMAMIPLRELFKHFGNGTDQILFNELDSAINGPIGVGQTWSTLQPSIARKFFQAYSSDQRNSMLADSMRAAIANLAAAGMLPAADAPVSVRQQFMDRIKTQVRTQLYLRAALGMFSFASPSQPSEGTSASQSDYMWNISGIKQLSDQYKQILNEVNGDVAHANAIWTTLHPDDVVYKDGNFDPKNNQRYSAFEVPGSESLTRSVYLPPTVEALQWMANHEGFIKKYSSVSAYFLPISSGDNKFSADAYRSQLELALRQRKTPDEFYSDVQTRNAENIYWSSRDQFDAQITAAKQAGDTAKAKALEEQKSIWSSNYKQLNPLFAAKQAEFDVEHAKAGDQVRDLRQMLSQGDVPDNLSPLLSKLVKTYDGYESFINQHRGSDQASKDQRAGALAMFNQWAQTNLAGGPLSDLFNGVFHTLITNLAQVQVQS